MIENIFFNGRKMKIISNLNTEGIMGLKMALGRNQGGRIFKVVQGGLKCLAKNAGLPPPQFPARTPTKPEPSLDPST